MSVKNEQINKDSGFKIMGISPLAFAIIAAVVLGAILNEIGNRLPIVKDYLGGGPIIVIFGSAALVLYKVLPQQSIEIVDNFMKGESFLDFYIAALITDSILGMDRKLLIKASLRYLPVIIGGSSIWIDRTSRRINGLWC